MPQRGDRASRYTRARECTGRGSGAGEGEEAATALSERDNGLELPEKGAFAGLYEAYADRVYRYLLSRTNSVSEAEELTSRTFLNALQHLDQYRARGGASFATWLMTIAHNLLANWYRDRGRRPASAPLDEALSLPTDIPGPESSLERNERLRQLREAVGQLPEERQRLITLKYVDGLPNAEIGRMMGRTEGAVKALHHRTLRQLQEALPEAADQ